MFVTLAFPPPLKTAYKENITTLEGQLIFQYCIYSMDKHIKEEIACREVTSHDKKKQSVIYEDSMDWIPAIKES